MATTQPARITSLIDNPARGSSSVAPFPIAIRSAIELAPSFEDRIRAQLAGQVGHGAGIERATVRFEDVNGPKGGVDTICRIKLVVSGRPSLFAEKRDTSVGRAFAAAVHAIGIAIDRSRERHHAEVASARALTAALALSAGCARSRLPGSPPPRASPAARPRPLGENTDPPAEAAGAWGVGSLRRGSPTRVDAPVPSSLRPTTITPSVELNSLSTPHTSRGSAGGVLGPSFAAAGSRFARSAATAGGGERGRATSTRFARSAATAGGRERRPARRSRGRVGGGFAAARVADAR
jgi:hypothetical protein